MTLATGTGPAAYLPAPGDVNVLYVDATTNALKNVVLATGTSTDLGGYVSAITRCGGNG